MRIDIATIFPAMFAGPLGASIIARAQEAGLLDIRIHDLRDYTSDRHRTVDDYPYGGGAGMVMRPGPFFGLHDRIVEDAGGPRPKAVLFSPAGAVLRQPDVRRLSAEPWLLLLCGHYEGVDERVALGLCAEEISVGDYVLTGGELPAMILVDAVSRLIPGVLGAIASLDEESFASGMLEYPQYTRPPEIRGLAVPEVLLSGDHGAVAKWRRRESFLRTLRRRPELLRGTRLSAEEQMLLEQGEASGAAGGLPPEIVR